MTAPHTPGEHEVELVSGRYFDLDNPDPAALRLDDIATPLAKECRYGGACWGHYSVAEHAVLVASKLRKIGAPLSMQMAGLHHDDAEFVTKDVQRPAKMWLRAHTSGADAYRDLTARMDATIWRALAFTAESPIPLWSVEDLHAPLLKEVDVWACRFEASQIMPSRGRNWENVWLKSGAVPIPSHGDDRIECLDWQIARNAYLDAHHSLALEMLVTGAV